MAERTIQLDLMELADLGQPTKIAHEVHRQLREQFDALPLRMPLEAIAKAAGIVGIQLFDTDEFEGTLVIKDRVGAIGLRRGLRPGRRAFTLGHEIGHFLIPNHRLQRPRFACQATDLNKRRSGGGNFASRPVLERIEVEANEFSAALLVPMPEFRTQLKRLPPGCDVSHPRTLANLFGVSMEFMAQLYINNVDEKAAIVTSHKGVVQRVITPAGGFPHLGLRRGMPLPARALAKTYRAVGERLTSDLCEILPDRWLEERGSVSAIYEQVMLQEGEWATTLIVVDEEEPDDEADDRNWNRRTARR